jgi:hypothetical protein
MGMTDVDRRALKGDSLTAFATPAPPQPDPLSESPKRHASVGSRAPKSTDGQVVARSSC